MLRTTTSLKKTLQVSLLKQGQLRSTATFLPYSTQTTCYTTTTTTTTTTPTTPANNNNDIANNNNNTNRGTKFKPITSPTLGDLPKLYKELSKAKLAALVALTTMGGFAMAPGAIDIGCLFYTTVGTSLCIASANSINQWIEIPYDAQMLRTRNRVLGRRALTPLHGFNFGILTGAAGVTTLATMVNPLTAALGAANILLYTAIYTPMKRASIANTWAGAIVGGIPPMMGWTAVTNALDPGAWVLGGILYAWQFPHFNSLAWNLRADYSKAGYRMMSVTDPKLNARVSLRYSLAMVPLCLSLSYMDITSWLFAVDSTVVNAALIVGAIRFWRKSNDKNARQLFFGSVVHLPVLLALMMVHKINYQTEYEEIIEEE